MAPDLPLAADGWIGEYFYKGLKARGFPCNITEKSQFRSESRKSVNWQPQIMWLSDYTNGWKPLPAYPETRRKYLAMKKLNRMR